MKIGTLNISGLRTLNKVHAIEHYIDKFNIDILLLQETHVDTLSLGREIESSLGGKMFWSFGQNDSRGVGIFFSSKCKMDVVRFHHDFEGRLLYVDFDKGEYFRIINIYAHTDERQRKQFFKDLIHVLNTRRTIILGGDFNCVKDTGLDKIGGNMDRGTAGWKELNDSISACNLRDVFRTLHPNIVNTTWIRNGIACRLDRFYISNNITHLVTAIEQEPTISDHEIVIMHIKDTTKDFNIGKGTWIFPNKLLEDDDFKHELYFSLMETMTEPEDDHMLKWWDNLKSLTKNMAKEWSRDRKKLADIHYTELCNDYRKYEKEKNATEMGRVKTILTALESEKARGAILRSKAKILDSNEDPSAYFVKKEIHQGRKNLIEEIEIDGAKTKKQPDILKAFQRFYSDLYQADQVNKLTHDYVKDLPKLENEENIGDPITLEDIKNALTQMENDKTPGPDGLTKEFYLTNIDFLGPLLVKLYKVIFADSKLSTSMKLSHITLICKDDTAPHLCKNYRPISLLNIDYKIISKVLSNRLRPLLPMLIHPDQTCSIKGRSIQDNCSYLRDIVDDINYENDTGILLSLDQEKAFDRVDHNYLLDLLKMYGFSQNFLKWIRILYTDICSSVLVNGHVSESFNVTRSVRQGCPLSPLLYILALEPVLVKIRNDKDIQGCPIPGKRTNPPKLTAFADDCKFAVKSDRSVSNIIKHFDNYKEFSGSKLNKGKTELMYLGRWRRKETSINNIKVVKSMTVFGIKFGNVTEEERWRPLIDSIKKKLNFYSLRRLSYFGRAKLINIMIFPKIWYLATIFPPNKNHLKEIEHWIFNYMWVGKGEKIKRNTMYLPINQGGTGLVNIECKYLSLFLRQIMKVFNNDETPWVNFGHMYLGLALRRHQGYNFDNCSHPHRVIERPGFYAEVKKALVTLQQTDPDFKITSNSTSKFFYQKLLSLKTEKPRCLDKHPHINFQTIFSALDKSLLDPTSINITFKLIHDIIPVADRLYLYYGNNINPFCLNCTHLRETTHHLFLHCPLNQPAKQWLTDVCYTALNHNITYTDITLGPQQTQNPFSRQIMHFIAEYRYAVWLARNRWRYEHKPQGQLDSLYIFKNRIQLRLQTDYIRLKQMIFERQWVEPKLAEYTDNKIHLLV